MRGLQEENAKRKIPDDHTRLAAKDNRAVEEKKEKQMKTAWWLSLCSVVVVMGGSSISSAGITFAGDSSGTFEDPTGPVGMVTTGVGTNHFTWGDGRSYGTGPSWLEFTGVPFSTTSDVPFAFGTLTYFNGTIEFSTRADTVDLNTLLTFTTPSGVSQDFTYHLGLVNISDRPTPTADYVYLPGTVPSTHFTEGGVDYTLEFLGFGTVTGSGFTTVDSFHVQENSTASTELLGRITGQTTIPVPGAALLSVLGVGCLGASRRVRRALQKN